MKIYLVRGILSKLTILEIQLLRKTPTQLRVSPKQVRAIWKADPESYIPYISTRLYCEHENWFETLPEAVDCAANLAKEDLERSIECMHKSQLQVASLAALKETLHAA